MIVAEARNRVMTDGDVTAHAKMVLVRDLERAGRLGLLAHGVVCASCEPCPMCVGALFWAGARRVVHGLSSARLTALATPPGGEAYGFGMTAAEIGGAATPLMSIVGPRREDEGRRPTPGSG